MQRPKYEIAQERVMRWLAKAHARRGGEVEETLLKVGTGEKKAQFRGTFYDDCLHHDWEKMEVHERTMGERMRFYDRHVTQAVEKFYTGVDVADQVIHVSCTGYVAPNGVQKLVAKKRPDCVVTNAYHMGCYAAMPAVRMGLGFLATGADKVDVVHTELCSIHMGTHLHEMEQLIAESLFSDGLIKYSVGSERRGYEVLEVREQIVPETLEHMGWYLEEWGMRMSLSGEIPLALGRAIKGFIEKMQVRDGSYFAIHPGGPRIIEQIARMLKLNDWQVEKSYAVFQQYGNMSSATVPHIWASLEQDLKIGDEVISLGFGPGLTIAGARLRWCG